MTPKQCRMARSGLGWTVNKLAEAAQVRPNTVSNFERGKGVQMNTMNALKNALLATGQVEFRGDNCVCIGGEEK